MVNQFNAPTEAIAKVIKELDHYQLPYEFLAPNYLKVWTSGPRDPLLAVLREQIGAAGLLLIDQHRGASSDKTINTFWMDSALFERKAK